MRIIWNALPLACVCVCWFFASSITFRCPSINVSEHVRTPSECRLQLPGRSSCTLVPFFVCFASLWWGLDFSGAITALEGVEGVAKQLVGSPGWWFVRVAPCEWFSCKRTGQKHPYSAGKAILILLFTCVCVCVYSEVPQQWLPLVRPSYLENVWKAKQCEKTSMNEEKYIHLKGTYGVVMHN